MDDMLMFVLPAQLMDILSNPAYHNMICWLPHGHGFIIKDNKTFTAEILPKYFKQAKFTSFTRKLNRW
jgi:HSF-type DNA-binding